MGKLYYFQAPSLDINPESDIAPKLGSIISTPKMLTAPLNQYDRLSIPQSLMNQSVNANFVTFTGSDRGASLGLNAAALQGLAGSVDVTYAFARNNSVVHHCELLETTEFHVTKEFVTQSILASQTVQDFLANSLPFRKRVYMVTGLKIATNFSSSAASEDQYSPTLKVGLDATALGVPLKAGPEIGLTVAKNRAVSHGPALNKIVFAYRVIRIKVKRDGEPQYKYRRGGIYSVDDDDSDEDEEWDLEPLVEDHRWSEFPGLVEVMYME